MSQEWHHLSPVILTDDIFFGYLDVCLNSGTAASRAAAYAAAERDAIQHIGSPLLPTIITGSFAFPQDFGPIWLPFQRVQSIDGIIVHSVDSLCTCAISTDDGCAILLDAQFGVIYTNTMREAYYRGCGRSYPPFKVEVAYTSGLSTGTAADHTGLHMGLAFVAEIYLNEIVDPAANEGGAGDRGVRSLSSLGYQEGYYELPETAFGRSSRANMAAKLTKDLKRKNRPLKIPSRRGYVR